MRRTPILAATVASLCLVVAYVALGGTSFKPTPVHDPCTPRESRPAQGRDEQLQLIVLDAADVTACGLGVSREELVLSLRSVDELEALADEKHVSRDRLEDALRAGLAKAVDTAQAEDLVDDRTAGVLAFAARRLPLGLLLAILRGATGLLGI